MRPDDATTPRMRGGERRDALPAFIESLGTRLRNASGATPLPADIEAVARQVQRDEPFRERFLRAATTIGMTVDQATTADWTAAVVKLLRQHDAKAVVLTRPGDGFLSEERLRQLGSALTDAGFAGTDEPDADTLFSADAGVTGVAAAIAEAGSLVCESSPLVARGSSLIPPVHIAVVGASQIVPDLYDCLAALGDRPGLPANVSLITGPSKTADIEGILVTGVHGPGDVHVVLVMDD
jgi:L-lactate dehydrogenase complex protein LldG